MGLQRRHPFSDRVRTYDQVPRAGVGRFVRFASMRPAQTADDPGWRT